MREHGSIQRANHRAESWRAARHYGNQLIREDVQDVAQPSAAVQSVELCVATRFARHSGVLLVLQVQKPGDSRSGRSQFPGPVGSLSTLLAFVRLLRHQQPPGP